LFAITWTQDADELRFVLDEYLVAETGFLKQLESGLYKITPKGWVHSHSLELQNSQARQSFIAMWFDDRVNEAWKAIDQGIRAAGFAPLRIDQKQHNNEITDETIAAFAAILRGAPQARLLLKNRTLAEESNRAAVHARFGHHGIAAERVLMDGAAEHFAFLAAYERVDIALDAFPYSGGTTTMEALWQGVPVLTFNGDRWASRTSRSLLLAAGLDAWCLADRDAFVAQAIALAAAPATPAELAALRAAMRDRLARTPACDGAALCCGLEGLYEQIARRLRGS
jgi:hypothetical protein